MNDCENKLKTKIEEGGVEMRSIIAKKKRIITVFVGDTK
jgi:hypothetical protein